MTNTCARCPHQPHLGICPAGRCGCPMSTYSAPKTGSTTPLDDDFVRYRKAHLKRREQEQSTVTIWAYKRGFWFGFSCGLATFAVLRLLVILAAWLGSR
jgi:hypothetical protein